MERVLAMFLCTGLGAVCGVVMYFIMRFCLGMFEIETKTWYIVGSVLVVSYALVLFMVPYSVAQSFAYEKWWLCSDKFFTGTIFGGVMVFRFIPSI